MIMAATELEAVREDLTAQVQQAIGMADRAKEESEEQRRKAQDFEYELTAKSRIIHDLEQDFGREKEQWEATLMRTELDGLRELEDIRRKFDRERERFGKEQQSLIERLRKELATERERSSHRNVDLTSGSGVPSEAVDIHGLYAHACTGMSIM